MKLYTSRNSNFGARIAMAVRAKGIVLEEAPVPKGGLRSDAFRAINPFAKIPVLCLDDGTILPESGTILRYLEARFPNPSLYPSSAEDSAKVDLVARLMDHYVMAPVIRLFPHLAASDRDPRVVDDEVARWHNGLSDLAHFLGNPLSVGPTAVSIADCVLMPSLHLGTRIAAMLELPGDPMALHDNLVTYYRHRLSDPIIGEVIEALTFAQEEKDVQYGLPSLVPYHRRAAGLVHIEDQTGDMKS